MSMSKMGIAGVKEDPDRAQSNDGYSIANIIYVLYIIGFFTGLTALIGVILAYANRNAASPLYKSHFNFQIMIFWRGIVLLVLSGLLYFDVGALGVLTYGLGFLLFIFPMGLGLWWLVWTIMAIAKGMGALGRQERIQCVGSVQQK